MPGPEDFTSEDWYDMPRSMRNVLSREGARKRSISRDHGHPGCDECAFARSVGPPIRDYRDLPMRLPAALRQFRP